MPSSVRRSSRLQDFSANWRRSSGRLVPCEVDFVLFFVCFIIQFYPPPPRRQTSMHDQLADIGNAAVDTVKAMAERLFALPDAEPLCASYHPQVREEGGMFL